MTLKITIKCNCQGNAGDSNYSCLLCQGLKEYTETITDVIDYTVIPEVYGA